MRTLIAATATLALALGGAAQARDVQDGNLQVKPSKDGKYLVESAKLGKAEFFGYVGDYVDSKKITGIMLHDGDKASDEQKHIVAITAKAQKINAFVEIGGKEIALVDPLPSAPATPPPADDVTPVTPVATPATAAAPAAPATAAEPATPAAPAAPAAPASH